MGPKKPLKRVSFLGLVENQRAPPHLFELSKGHLTRLVEPVPLTAFFSDLNS